MRGTHDIQGRFLGIPYDWRWPDGRKIAERIWRPGGSAFVPKVWGWGWTLNLAHPRVQGFVAAVLVVGVLSVLFS